MGSLRKRLEKCCFAPRLKARAKPTVLAELADIMVSNGAIKPQDRDAVLGSLVEREAKMSTGMQLGVAIPHAKSDRVRQLLVTVAISREGVDFDSIDKQPAHIFVATVSPETDIGGHIRFLADISRQLASRTVREKVRAANTNEELIDALCGDIQE